MLRTYAMIALLVQGSSAATAAPCACPSPSPGAVDRMRAAMWTFVGVVDKRLPVEGHGFAHLVRVERRWSVHDQVLEPDARRTAGLDAPGNRVIVTTPEVCGAVLASGARYLFFVSRSESVDHCNTPILL